MSQACCRCTATPLKHAAAPPGAQDCAAASSDSDERDLQTAFVQDMLATDPVLALGMRVAAASGSDLLEYLSLDEAKADLSAPSHSRGASAGGGVVLCFCYLGHTLAKVAAKPKISRACVM